MANHPRKVPLPFLLFFFLLSFRPDACQAQSADEHASFAVWSGANFANGHIFGFEQDRRMVQVGFSWAPVLVKHSWFVLRYRFDVLPVALLHDYHFGPPGEPFTGKKDWVYGGGLNPVGAQFDFRNRTRIRPFIDVTGGFLYFQRPVLDYDETQFQFTIGPGVGARFPLVGRTRLEVGYRYLHMSNANIDHSNPGLDSQMLYCGLTF